MTAPIAEMKLARLIAILRGLPPRDVESVCDCLIEAGISAVEVPLNGEHALETIAKIHRRYGSRLQLGAGTVLTPDEVKAVRNAGARFVFSPHFDEQIVARCLELGCMPVPGVATPTEGFAAMRAGARVLKLFPAQVATPEVVKAWRSVFPNQIALVPVGGIDADSVQPYLKAGASALAAGGWLYRPDIDLGLLAKRAVQLVHQVQEFASC